MNSLSDFATVVSIQQQHKLREMQDESQCQPPLGGALSFGSKPWVKLLLLLVLLPCIAPIWLLVTLFRLPGKFDQLKSRFKPKSTAKK